MKRLTLSGSIRTKKTGQQVISVPQYKETLNKHFWSKMGWQYCYNVITPGKAYKKWEPLARLAIRTQLPVGFEIITEPITVKMQGGEKMKIVVPVNEIPLGKRVKLTTVGLFHFRHGSASLNENTRGAVVGYGRKKNRIRILRDNYRTVETYASRFWEPAQDQEAVLNINYHKFRKIKKDFNKEWNEHEFREGNSGENRTETDKLIYYLVKKGIL